MCRRIADGKSDFSWAINFCFYFSFPSGVVTRDYHCMQFADSTGKFSYLKF